MTISNRRADAFCLLAGRLLVQRVGATFFADPARLHRDLLGDAAKEALEKDK